MHLISLQYFVWQHRRIIVVLLAIIIVQFFEFTLLHYRYEIFTGGFLQPFSFKTIPQRLIFILLSLWFNFALFGTLANRWFFITDKLNKYGITIYYYFFVIVLLSMGFWLGLKFKVLSYFNDTLNFEILRNLGGGSFKSALLYVSNEITFFIGILSIICIGFLISVQVLKKVDYKSSFRSSGKEEKITNWLLIFVLLLTPGITLFVSNNAYLRYGLDKITSYRLVSKGMDILSDVDFDGYGIFSYPKDKSVINAAIYPGALDIPGNGIDEDGYLGDAELVDYEHDNLSVIKAKPGKHIILIVLESARADLLTKKYKGEFVAPVIRKIANNGSFIPFAYSHTGYTTSSIKAIFNRALISNTIKIKLVDFLQSAGYQLSFISGQDESFGNVATEVGMNHEANYFFDVRSAIDDRVFVSKEQGSLRLSEERLIEQFRDHFNSLDFNTPQFIYLNFQAAHFPYTHPKMSKRIIDNMIPRSEINHENRNWVSSTYWNAIANADWAVGQVIDVFDQQNLLDNVTIVILGDHGESLFDDGFLGHGHAINEIQTKIPLIINDPSIVIDQAIGQTDVAEILIRSALGLTNHWIDNDKAVFQVVGTLSKPTLMAQVQHGGIRTLFDFRSEQVYFSDYQLWKPYKEALLEPFLKERVVQLISSWETLRWHNHLKKNHNVP